MTTHSSIPAPQVDTVVIGAGQAGLSVAYHLGRLRRSCVVLERNRRIGDNWRSHWDSLRLYSAARYDGLPGMPFPAPDWTFPGKDDVADYLAAYAAKFDLPVRTGAAVRRVSRDGDGFAVEYMDDDTHASHLRSRNLVVATGTFGRQPAIPSPAQDLDPEILQLHSSRYRNPSQLKDGPVLVVGASHSGADIAHEVSATHHTILSGRDTGQVPFAIEKRSGRVGFRIIFFVFGHVMSLRTPVGRRMRAEVRHHGGPLIRYRAKDLAADGVERVFERTVDVRDGMPMLADGRVLDVANVVWCTGFQQELAWLDVPVLDEQGWPLEHRGIVESVPGLYFSGLAFQSSFRSMLIGGAGADAAYVARHIARHRAPGPQVTAADSSLAAA
ncbi:MAG TPA: FAD-dependent oxidoreductase [Actinomycetales bacterium]|nr:FAD-dependent oxidoreductase [Actinomycetales bacterium]